MESHSLDGTTEPRQQSATEIVDMRSEATGTVMARLRAALEKVQQVELERLYDRLPKLNEQTRREIHQFSDRLVAKVLDPPLKSLDDEAGDRPQQALLDSLKRLFQLPPIN